MRLSCGWWHEKCSGAAALTDASDDGGVQIVPAPPRSANRSKACATLTMTSGPRTSVNSKFKTNPEFGFWRGKNSQARRKNLEKFVDV
jgi:hypothetical protein